MIKRELIQAVVDAVGDVDKKVVARVVDAVFDSIVGGCKGSGIVQVPGFGTFRSKFRPVRMGPKPGTRGEKMEYPASATITFKPSKEVKGTILGSVGT